MTTIQNPPDDPFGIVFGGLGAGLGVGLGFQALAAFAVRTIQAGEPAAQALDLGSRPAMVLLAGTFVAAIAAGVTTWRVVSPLGNPWRQGVLSLVATFGSFALAMVAMPVDRLLGRPGLLLLAALSFAAAWLVSRRARPGAA